MTNDLGVWTADDCALVLIDYQKEMFEVIRSEPTADYGFPEFGPAATAATMPATTTTRKGVKLTTETTTITSELPDYAPVPQSALGPALNEQGYYVGRVERNLYWITDGTYQSAF